MQNTIWRCPFTAAENSFPGRLQPFQISEDHFVAPLSTAGSLEHLHRSSKITTRHRRQPADGDDRRRDGPRSGIRHDGRSRRPLVPSRARLTAALVVCFVMRVFAGCEIGGQRWRRREWGCEREGEEGNSDPSRGAPNGGGRNDAKRDVADAHPHQSARAGESGCGVGENALPRTNRCAWRGSPAAPAEWRDSLHSLLASRLCVLDEDSIRSSSQQHVPARVTRTQVRRERRPSADHRGRPIQRIRREGVNPGDNFCGCC